VILQANGHTGGGCGEREKYFEVGALVDAKSVYEGRSGDSCSPAAHDGDSFYEIGAEVPITRFAPLGLLTVGDGAVRTRFNAATPARGAVGREWLVDARDQTLATVRLTDGKLHGVAAPMQTLSAEPSRTPGSSAAFTDSTCTHEAIVVYGGPCTAPSDPPIVATASSATCSNVTTLRATVKIKTAYVYTTNGCVPLTTLGEGATVYAANAVMAPEAFPLLSEVTE
jgi:hypothetical protein